MEDTQTPYKWKTTQLKRETSRSEIYSTELSLEPLCFVSPSVFLNPSVGDFCPCDIICDVNYRIPWTQTVSD